MQKRFINTNDFKNSRYNDVHVSIYWILHDSDVVLFIFSYHSTKSDRLPLRDSDVGLFIFKYIFDKQHTIIS